MPNHNISFVKATSTKNGVMNVDKLHDINNENMNENEEKT